jgi:hypothetical protein
MSVTSENITVSNAIAQQEYDMLSSILFHNTFIVSDDNKERIAYKIEKLKSLREYLIKSVEIDDLPSSNQQLIYIKLLSRITHQIENFEILSNVKKIDSLKRASKSFAQKTQFPIGFTE